MQKFWIRLGLSAALMALPVFGAAYQATHGTTLFRASSPPLPCPPCFPTSTR